VNGINFLGECRRLPLRSVIFVLLT
jgi:hypothetical protein